MYVGQLLTCNTRAVPAAHAYNWTKDNTEDAGTTQSITIPSQWLGQHVRLECEAMNSIGTDSVLISFRVVRKYFGLFHSFRLVDLMLVYCPQHKQLYNGNELLYVHVTNMFYRSRSVI